MKTICIILYVSILFASCNKLFPDEQLKFQRQNYEGNELKVNGYYYMYSDNGGIIVKYLFSNGIILSGYFHSTTNLNEVEIKMVKEYDLLQKDKSRWGVFVINDNSIQYSRWVHLGLRFVSVKCLGIIDNDTTFRFIKNINPDGKEFSVNDIYHFRRFSPKPDSTNIFIK